MSDTPWDDLAPDTGRRVDSRGRWDFFWVRMPDGAAGMILKLEEGTLEVFPLPKLRNLTLSYQVMDGRRTFCIRLADRSQIDIFETLCRDVIAAAGAVEDAGSALACTIQRTLRWHHLLRGGSVDGLTLEEQRGLVAELAVLRDLSARFGPLTAVDAWKGPEGSAKDFELSTMLIEVKARRGAAHPKITISSDVQLEAVAGFSLYLRVLDVDTAIASAGLTLTDHVAMTGAVIAPDLTAFDLWERRLAAAGFDPADVDERRVWKIGKSRTYEVKGDFPRLTPPLPHGVGDVRYSINLHLCAPYEIPDCILSPKEAP
ncbi:PD-(D/E)XK motif protein [Paracoccus marcusii]|uniref:PD-(D/E)XK motif protein n=1 Tax=Paracoccus marcusii TaxID=59779 RepID=UPI002490C367|nr:PD-(D/E)XK motif protein [Paracoccus marcusii]